MAKTNPKRTVRKTVSKAVKKTSKKVTMGSYESFDLWMADQSLKHKQIIKVLRSLVNKTSQTLSETVKWGNGCFAGKEWQVIYLFAGYDILQFGFFSGACLSDADPKMLLQGKGKSVRHIPVETVKDIDLAAFKRLIKRATRYERE